MESKLKELKTRAENLRYKDKQELDDILRKTKMYLEKIFPNKFTYSHEVDRINFMPMYALDKNGYEDAWQNAKQELINLLDTRIEESLIGNVQKETSQHEIQVVEKIIKVEDKTKINQLTKDIETLRNKKNLWERINWAVFLPIIFTAIGGSFYFGKTIGENKFDNEKLDLLYSNKSLNSKIDTLNKNNAKFINQIEVLESKTKK